MDRNAVGRIAYAASKLQFLRQPSNGRSNAEPLHPSAEHDPQR
jgi:hypothetical protein